ncbi:FecR domain-containing protein [Shinella curvata]|uniref:FecR domain-containing protein n=1 Tax=Shinella curvata TaxID=1817964 RepID=A0ABT8XM54_9HYPH|nr:FecR domain-containing protein [Shinella curvata]MCJ8055778.1 FecR domain-containing protein [Shinella curvata]MDO6124800.1 FecR domain-containing protein [Shinella curvata]
MGYEQADSRQRAGTYTHPDPAVDEALDWFLRLQDEDTPETLRAFDAWGEGRPDRVQAFDEIVRMQGMASLRLATLADRDRQREERRQAGRTTVARRPIRPWRLGYAAMAAIVLAAMAWQQIPGLLLQWRSDYLTATGERQTITLPDGSSVVLNTASAIAIDFDKGARRVTLLGGEAYFDVRHDAEHPFIVAGHFSDVEVKGTAFGVLAEDARDTIVLERGRVDVTRRAERGERAILEPGQMVIATDEGLSAVTGADPAQSLAWREGRIVFHDRAFRAALSELQRYYDGQVLLVSGRFANRLVSGNYRVDDPEAAIRTLAASAGASVTRLPGGVLILR